MSECGTLNYSSNNGSVKKNFQAILKESYWGLNNIIK